jgi:hypothetical protein
MRTLQDILDKMEMEEPTAEEIAYAKMIEAKRCAAVDRFYKEMGDERPPEAVITRRLYRKSRKTDRGLAYN